MPSSGGRLERKLEVQAAFVDRLGPADAIRYGELPQPEPGPADVLVRVEAAAVNRVDTFVRSGAYPTPLPFPFVVGRDLVGRVAARGPGASQFEVGDPVWSNSLGHAGRQGSAAEYAVVGADRLYPLPADVEPTVMAALVHPAATAYLALMTHGSLQAGETVLVAGAAGHVGRAATVLAVRAGARVVATASAADLQTCRELGADVVLDRRRPDLHQRIEQATPNGVNLHLDTSGNHDLDAAMRLLAHRGRIVVMAGLGARPSLPVGAFYTRDARIAGFAISNASIPELAAAARRINELVAENALVPKGIEILELSEAASAHRRLEAGLAAGVRQVLQCGNARATRPGAGTSDPGRR
jgi:NADPH:quinone reductase-like Zn-dependent oxidoreductase